MFSDLINAKMGMYSLPLELVALILSYLTAIKDLNSFACTSKQNNEMTKGIKKKRFWRRVVIEVSLLQDFPDGYVTFV